MRYFKLKPKEWLDKHAAIDKDGDYFACARLMRIWENDKEYLFREISKKELDFLPHEDINKIIEIPDNPEEPNYSFYQEYEHAFTWAFDYEITPETHPEFFI